MAPGQWHPAQDDVQLSPIKGLYSSSLLSGPEQAATLPASLWRLCNALHSSHAHVGPSIVSP